MKGIIHDQTKDLDLLQERQRIIKELNEIKVSSTVSLDSLRDNHQVTINYDQAIEEIYVWSKSYRIFGLLEHGVSLSKNFENASVLLSIEDSYQTIGPFFKSSFNIKAKIKAIERAHFKIFIP
jgi:hypothetical protein